MNRYYPYSCNMTHYYVFWGLSSPIENYPTRYIVWPSIDRSAQTPAGSCNIYNTRPPAARVRYTKIIVSASPVRTRIGHSSCQPRRADRIIHRNKKKKRKFSGKSHIIITFYS